MIPKWLTDSIYAKRQFKKGDVELSLCHGELAWRFDIDEMVTIGSHRVEFLFPTDHHSNTYRFSGKFLIPSWCDFTLGGAVILQWHGQRHDYFTLEIADAGKNLRIYSSHNTGQDGKESEIVMTTPLIRDQWITFDGEYRWNDGEGYCHFNGSLNAVPFTYKGLKFRDMYWKYGCYRTGHLEGHYPAVQIWWTDCSKS